MVIVDRKGFKHRVVAIGKVFRDHEEIRLKIKEMYPHCDRIIIKEGKTEDNFFESKGHDLSTLNKIPDPNNKITILQGDSNDSLKAMKELWSHCKVGDIVYIFGADEYMSSSTWSAVLQEFKLEATRVNLPLFNLWHDFNWRSINPFKWHERFILKQANMYWENHYTLRPDYLKDRRMINMDEKYGLDFAIYHTCWTKSIDRLLKRSIRYYIRDYKLTKDKMLKMSSRNFLKNFRIKVFHIFISDYMNGSTEGYDRFQSSQLPEILKEHSKYGYNWDGEPLNFEKVYELYHSLLPYKNPIERFGPSKITLKKIPKNPILLFICENDWAGVCNRLTEAVNRHTDWKAYNVVKNITKYGPNLNNIVVNEHNRALIKDLMDTANVVVFGSSFYKYRPLNLTINKNAFIGVWHGGTSYRLNYAGYNKNCHPQMDFVFAHRDLEGLYPGTIRLQAPFNVEDYKYKNKNYNKIIIAHSPSDKARKGTQHFMDAMGRLKTEFGDKIEIDLIENVSNEEAIERKKKCHIYYDNLWLKWPNLPEGATYSYGVALIEAATFGAVCLSRCEYKDSPLMTVRNSDDIYERCKYLINNKPKMGSISMATRRWAYIHHNYDNVAKPFISFLNIHLNQCQQNFDKIEKVFHSHGVPNKIKHNGKEMLFVRDVPPLQNKTYTPLSGKNQRIYRNRTHFITVAKHCGEQAQEYLFLKDVPFSVHKNLPNYKYSSQDKRNEFVYIDNSSCSHSNYKKIIEILLSIKKNTGLDVVFISRNFHDILRKLIGSKKVKCHHISDYDFNSRYGLIIDALSHDGYFDGFYRKFWLYLSHGMVPVIHSKFQGMIKYCRKNNINFKEYKTPANLKNTNIYSNHNRFEYTFEDNYPTLLDIINKNI